MPLIFRLFAGLGLWLIGEYVAFSFVAQEIGVDGAVIVTLATSLLGILLLRRLGFSARQKIVEVLNNRGDLTFLAPQRMGAGFAAALGSLLLILPGFLSDLVGLFLLARSGWDWRNSGPPKSFSDPKRVVELSPQDWHRIDESEQR
jgi:UPF0716 protein FxsA